MVTILIFSGVKEKTNAFWNLTTNWETLALEPTSTWKSSTNVPKRRRAKSDGQMFSFNLSTIPQFLRLDRLSFWYYCDDFVPDLNFFSGFKIKNATSFLVFVWSLFLKKSVSCRYISKKIVWILKRKIKLHQKYLKRLGSSSNPLDAFWVELFGPPSSNNRSLEGRWNFLLDKIFIG